MLKYKNTGVLESKECNIIQWFHQLILIEACVTLKANLIFFHKTVCLVFEENSWLIWTFSFPVLSPHLVHEHDHKSMNHSQFLSTESILVYLDLYLRIYVNTKYFFKH